MEGAGQSLHEIARMARVSALKARAVGLGNGTGGANLGADRRLQIP